MTKPISGRDHATPRPIRNTLCSALLAIGMSVAFSVPASAQVSVGIRLPSVRIGINIPLYPQLVAVPGYPVYYAPDLDSNLFFYDGVYWVYTQDGWYASSWYDGPWDLIEPEYVPYFLLRVPVRYYRRPPRYFRGWAPNGPPRWGDYWGNGWAQRHRDWDRWDRASRYTLAPLPSYQRSYSRDRYPSYEQQRQLHQRNYNYQPREPAVRQHFERQPPTERAVRPDGNPNAGIDRRQQQAPRTADPRRQPQSEAPPQHSQQPRGKPENTDKHDKSDKSDKHDKPDKPKGHDR